MKGSCWWRSSWLSALLLPLLAAGLWASVVGYKPVVIVHGLFDSSEDFKNLKRFINQVSCITDAGLGWWSRVSVGRQHTPAEVEQQALNHTLLTLEQVKGLLII